MTWSTCVLAASGQVKGIAATTGAEEFGADTLDEASALMLDSVVCIGRTAVSTTKVDDMPEPESEPFAIALVPALLAGKLEEMGAEAALARGVSVTVVKTVNLLVSVDADRIMTR